MGESPQEALRRSIKAAGGYSALAQLLGITQPAVFQWKRAPSARVLAIEKLTGVPKERLRPDLYPSAKEAAE
jgi:DNA-binding transcriptional regulator YdaS (Cro superfamily)